FGKALKLSADDQLLLERAALVRDVGKLKIPNRILLKDSVLTYDEWSMLRKHTRLGASLLEGTPALKDTADIVRRHHCCYDGTGYPDGLEGEQIPYLARVLKILDVYCAMTSPRHYREGSSTHKQALAHLRAERAKHFDPELVDVFIKSRVGKA
ncbi:MAG: HD domain-containing protein, partial [Candidatus Hydrogenedentes bacterium]|nr:HD domain-containing protein [Candidatus Hydrogenedentota bacterium]